MSDRMVYRWASRFLEIREKYGPKRASAWADAFLNEEDVDRVAKAVNDIVNRG